MESTIRLFKALPIESKRKKNPSKELLEETVRRGFIFAPEVVYNYSSYDDIVELVEKEVGLTPEQMNNSFHKSWKKVKEAPVGQLIIEQILHYFTTYGFEELGIYNENSVYIPNEKLEIPELEGNVKLVVIRGYTKDELKEKLLGLLNSGIALKSDTINDVLEVANFVKLREREVEGIKNKEVRVALYSGLDILPKNPTEFLRYTIYESTGRTLLIKSGAVIEEIRADKKKVFSTLFNKYKKQHGLERLAEIFYRFKPLFLAFREEEKARPIVNKIRKLAKKYHKPMKEDYFNTITGRIKNGETVSRIRLELALDKINTFRKIRLAYALKFRTTDAESILYRIRNGKGYASPFNFTYKSAAKRVLGIVIDSIVKDVGKNIKGKKIYLPEDIVYTLPSTEKQFTGNFPSGSYVTVPKDMIFGVHWENVGGRRIDLDLSLINADDGKIGWDSSYRTEDRGILFSGDVTDAPKPNGASELFYVKRQKLGSHIMLVNYFNYDEGVEVPFKIMVGKQQLDRINKNYMINPNEVVSAAKSIINQKQKVLGLVVTTSSECRFYFAETYLGKCISSSGSEFVDNSRKYLFDFYRNTINLNDVLKKAGAKFVKDKDKADIDLSQETLEKDTILNLVISK